MGSRFDIGAIEIAEAVRTGQLRATDVLDQALAAIEAGNEQLGAFVHVDEGAARAAAEAVDAAVAAGRDPGPFAGVPIGVKDLEDCAGMPTSNGSLAYATRGPVAADSIHVARLRAAGAVPVGKTAAPEFGTLNFTKSKVFGVARNPWNPERTPGGSSGGSAAAVAAGLVPVATASDGGGSTRIPASFCGLVGFKPSHGRIPHPGPTGSETAVYGLLTTTVADSARHLDVTAGPDERDRFSLPPPVVGYESTIESLPVAGLRARWSPDLGFARCDPEVRTIAELAAQRLAAAADLVVDGEPIHLTDPVRAWLGAGAMDLWFSLEDGMWPAVREDLTRYVRTVLEQTEDYPIPRYAGAVRRREALVADAARLFDDVDVLLTPTTAVPAFPAEGPPPEVIDGEAAHPIGASATPFTMLANLCWNPAVSVPAGLTADGLPVGLQIVARRHHDEIPLRLARVWEQTRPWPLRIDAADGSTAAELTGRG
ncbi:MAG TPA: amidase family protein [Acidimicrobiales bacterium]|nr:amidase family protein [Acidimicrobiales bacterium]